MCCWAELLSHNGNIPSVATLLLGLASTLNLRCVRLDGAAFCVSFVLVLESDLSPGFVQGEAYNCTAQEEPHAGIVGITIPCLLATLLRGS